MKIVLIGTASAHLDPKFKFLSFMQQIHVKCTLREKKYIHYVGMIKINYADITYVSGENLKTNEHNKEIVCKQSVWMAGYHTHYPSSLFPLLNYK